MGRKNVYFISIILGLVVVAILNYFGPERIHSGIELPFGWQKQGFVSVGFESCSEKDEGNRGLPLSFQRPESDVLCESSTNATAKYLNFTAGALAGALVALVIVKSRRNVNL
jgi:hypothetical protein